MHNLFFIFKYIANINNICHIFINFYKNLYNKLIKINKHNVYIKINNSYNKNMLTFNNDIITFYKNELSILNLYVGGYMSNISSKHYKISKFIILKYLNINIYYFYYLYKKIFILFHINGRFYDPNDIYKKYIYKYLLIKQRLLI